MYRMANEFSETSNPMNPKYIQRKLSEENKEKYSPFKPRQNSLKRIMTGKKNKSVRNHITKHNNYQPTVNMSEEPVSVNNIFLAEMDKNNIPDTYIPFIREWISIENIVTKDYDHVRITEMKNDPCEAKSKDECSKDNCVLHKKSNKTEICINESRKSDFRTPDITIKGDTGIEFKVIESNVLKDIPDEDDKIFYYQILESTNTKQKYVLFPTDYTHDVFDYPKIQNWLDEFATNLINSTENYCICGHSMGCVLSLNLGLLIQKKNNEYFKNKIVVIGSGPYQWLNDKNINFKNFDNVIVFIYSDIITQNKKKEMVIDCFSIKGMKSRSHYLPYYMIFNEDNDKIYIKKYNDAIKYENSEDAYMNLGEERINEINRAQNINKEQQEKFKEIFEVDSIRLIINDVKKVCNNIHSWENYRNAFKRLFPNVYDDMMEKSMDKGVLNLETLYGIVNEKMNPLDLIKEDDMKMFVDLLRCLAQKKEERTFNNNKITKEDLDKIRDKENLFEEVLDLLTK